MSHFSSFFTFGRFQGQIELFAETEKFLSKKLKKPAIWLAEKIASFKKSQSFFRPRPFKPTKKLLFLELTDLTDILFFLEREKNVATSEQKWIGVTGD